MTAVQATFSDFKIIKGRKVAVLMLEIPIEAANNALQCLGGVPNPESEQWVAVAALNKEAVREKPAEKTPKTPAQMAGILCNDPDFRKYLQANSHVEAASKVRIWCGVNSRGDIKEGTRAADLWGILLTEYDEWRGRIPRRDHSQGR